MQKILIKLDELSQFLGAIGNTFSMTYKAVHGTIHEAPDYFNTDVPTILTDRENMTGDIKSIGNDMRKSLKQRKTEFAQ